MALAFLFALAMIETGQPKADIRNLLQVQDFEWPLSKRYSEIRYVGDIKQHRNTYSLYLYNGTNPVSLHGINWLIVIRDHTHYLGVYHSGSASDCAVKGQAVECKADYPGRRIRFTKNGPPQKIWFDGEIAEFWLSQRFGGKH